MWATCIAASAGRERGLEGALGAGRDEGREIQETGREFKEGWGSGRGSIGRSEGRCGVQRGQGPHQDSALPSYSLYESATAYISLG